MRRRRTPSPLLAAFAILLAAAASAALPNGAAATVTPIAEGHLTWGVKESWRNYLIPGETLVDDGASINPDGTYDFPVVSGSFDDETGTTKLQLAGSVRWRSYSDYQGVPGRYGLDTTFKNLTLEIGPTVQEIRGDNIGYPREDPGGELEEETDVVLAKLDITGAATTFGGGESEWSNIPAIAGTGLSFYPSGTAMDPATVQYTGPGGLPKGEQWDSPGGIEIEPSARWVSDEPLGTFQNSGRRLYVSPAGEVVHVLELTGGGTVNSALTVTARDAQTLEQVGPSVELTAQDLTTAFDPETETIFYVSEEEVETTVHTVQWNAETPGYELGEVGALRSGREADGLVWNPVEDELAATNHLLAGEGASTYVEDEIRIFRQVEAEWVEVVEAPLPMPASGPYAGGSPRSPFACQGAIVRNPCLGVLSDGTYVQAPAEAFAKVNLPWPAIQIEINPSGEAVTAMIEGTEARQIGLGFSLGFSATAPGTGGSLVLHNTSWGAMSYARVGIVSGEPALIENPYFVSEHGNEEETSSFGRSLAADVTHGWEWSVAETDPDGFVLSAMQDRTFVGRFEYPELLATVGAYPAIGVAPDGSLYIPVEDEATGRFGYQLMQYLGRRADLDEQPADAVASLTVGEDSEEVSFTSTTTDGTPTPTRQWQVKAPGESAFTDLTSETAATLNVEATREMNGSRYRAVYTSAVGKIVSDEAALEVDYAPELLSQPQSRTVTEGANAVFLVAADAHPEATVSWQRSVSSSWQDIAADDEEFVTNGPSLTVPDTDTGQSGTVFRAKLVNTVGTTHSAPATLTVKPKTTIPPEGLDLAQVSLEWTGNEELQKSPPVGGSNYFSAGASDGSEETYSAASGNARIFQISAGGAEALATYATRAAHLSGGEQLVRLYGGTGRVEADRSATVGWTGSFTVNFYGGLVPFTFVDPQLVVNAGGTGTLSATMVGCASSKDAPGVCVPFAAKPGVTIADFSGVEVDPGGTVEIEPEYDGVEVNVPDSVAPQNRTAPGWGAWPQAFVDFHSLTGLSSYWYSSGGNFDAYKPPAPFAVNFEGGVAPPEPGGKDGDETLSPPDVLPPPPSARLPLLRRPPGGVARVNRNGLAVVLRVRCRGPLECVVRTRARTSVKIGGERFQASVLAPQKIAAGKSNAVRLRLPKAALRALRRGKPATARVWIGVRSGDRQVTRGMRVTLRPVG